VTTSYNGWPASPHPGDLGGLDNRDVPGAPVGVKLAPGVRAGDVADVLFAFAGQFHAHVEQLKAGQCWGYNFRVDTNDPKVLSCHASATAVDFNAPEHPNAKRGTFTPDQVTTLRAILAGFGGVIHWGGDFVGTDDEMHFEIFGSPAQVAAVAARLRNAAPPAPSGAHHDATGRGESFRAELGDSGPEVHEMQHDLNRYAPAYSHLAEDGIYGQATSDVVEEFAHRSGIPDADGNNVGPRIAHALAHDGLI
jgi:hypothetical protein